MTSEINPYMLKKDELEYEVLIRGSKPASNVRDLRTQVSRFIRDSNPILLPTDFDWTGELSVLKSKTDSLCSKLSIPSECRKKAQIDRLSSLACHLRGRATRFPLDIVDGELLVKIRAELDSVFIKLGNKSTDTDGDDSDSASQDSDVDPPSKHCYHRVTYVHPTAIHSLNLKYNGKTCVLSFLGRLDELVSSRSLNYSKVFRSAAELFTDSALLWYRGISASVDSWEDLKQELLDEFLPSDFDYRLMEELKARTQGVGETFSSYYSVMLNFFARLRSPISDDEKLRILRRNIRPAFAEKPALIPIVSLSDFKVKCKELEKQRLNSQYFVEPPKPNSQTLASDLAFKGNVPSLVAAVTASPQTQGTTLFCLRCRVNGHSLKTCTAERYLICFRCGEKGFTVTNCPRCVKSKPSVKVNTATYTCSSCQCKSNAGNVEHTASASHSHTKNL